jgi:hypothetical protein
MTRSTVTGGIRISPQLWAEFGRVCASQGRSRNSELVDLIRARVIEMGRK